MRILYLAQRVPYPPNRGDKIASYNAIRFLARRHEVVVGCLAESADDLEAAEVLRKRGFAVDAARLRPLARRGNVLKALAGSHQPLSVAYFRSSELQRKVAERARGGAIDAVVAFSSSMGQYAMLLPGVPLIADFIDLDSRKWELYADCHCWPRSAVYRMEERRLLAYERFLAQQARCTLVRTEAEREDCERLIPGARFEVLSNGVDLEYFRPPASGPAAKVGKDVVFTGVMDYFPNVQGVKFFAQQVLPLVRAQHPDATFTIVGARPTPEVLRLSRLPGVTVTGRQSDVRPFIARARVAVAPLLLARGIQNKVLEAMAMAVPVVVTPAAFRGVDTLDGAGVLVAAEPREFAAKVSSLLDDSERAAELGRLGRARVEKRYVWDDQLARLESLLCEVADASHRKEPCIANGGDQ